MKQQKKGEEGVRTGGTVRSLIRKLQSAGYTLEEIGRRTNRSASTLGQIMDGTIKNPPNSLVSALRKIPAKK